MSSVIVNNRVDFIAAGLSAACVAHCLALPILGAFAPLFAAWAELEWIHKVFVLLAAPLSLYAISRRTAMPGWIPFASMALTGLCLMVAAAFVEPLRAYETPLTALGGVLLSSAHIGWWRRHGLNPTGDRAAE